MYVCVMTPPYSHLKKSSRRRHIVAVHCSHQKKILLFFFDFFVVPRFNNLISNCFIKHCYYISAIASIHFTLSRSHFRCIFHSILVKKKFTLKFATQFCRCLFNSNQLELCLVVCYTNMYIFVAVLSLLKTTEMKSGTDDIS